MIRIRDVKQWINLNMFLVSSTCKKCDNVRATLVRVLRAGFQRLLIQHSALTKDERGGHYLPPYPGVGPTTVSARGRRGRLHSVLSELARGGQLHGRHAGCRVCDTAPLSQPLCGAWWAATLTQPRHIAIIRDTSDMSGTWDVREPPGWQTDNNSSEWSLIYRWQWAKMRSNRRSISPSQCGSWWFSDEALAAIWPRLGLITVTSLSTPGTSGWWVLMSSSMTGCCEHCELD